VAEVDFETVVEEGEFLASEECERDGLTDDDSDDPDVILSEGDFDDDNDDDLYAEAVDEDVSEAVNLLSNEDELASNHGSDDEGDSEKKFEKYMAEMKEMSVPGFTYLNSIPTKHWARHAFNTKCKSGGGAVKPNSFTWKPDNQSIDGGSPCLVTMFYVFGQVVVELCFMFYVFGQVVVEIFEEEFNQHAEKVTKLTQATNEDLLIIYGLYKQATIGDVNIARPGIFDPKGRAKWDSWKSCEGKSKDDCMTEYITKAKQMLEANGMA
ncbi:hypothetical protein KSS87_019848, partial [Heliosperma pusillum]